MPARIRQEKGVRFGITDIAERETTTMDNSRIAAISDGVASKAINKKLPDEMQENKIDQFDGRR